MGVGRPDPPLLRLLPDSATSRFRAQQSCTIHQPESARSLQLLFAVYCCGTGRNWSILTSLISRASRILRWQLVPESSECPNPSASKRKHLSKGSWNDET